VLKVGSECYSLGRKTANYKGQKFFLIRVKMEAIRGIQRAQSKVRRRGKGGLEAVLRTCRSGGTRRERWRRTCPRMMSGLAKSSVAPPAPR